MPLLVAHVSIEKEIVLLAEKDERSQKVADIFSNYAVGIGVKPLKTLVAELNEAKQLAADFAQGENEQNEVQKRYLEQLLFTYCENGASAGEVISVMQKICEFTEFDRERLSYIISIGLSELNKSFCQKTS